MMQPLVLRLPEDIKRKLESEAKRQKQSLAEVTRRAISSYLKARPTQKSGVDVLLEWAEKGNALLLKDDLKNLSTTYKEELYGKTSPKFHNVWKKKK